MRPRVDNACQALHFNIQTRELRPVISSEKMWTWKYKYKQTWKYICTKNMRIQTQIKRNNFIGKHYTYYNAGLSTYKSKQDNWEQKIPLQNVMMAQNTWKY